MIAVPHRLMDLQNYPRNRKSNRIHPPEALDSKTCPTIPVMGGGPSLRISVEQGLPLQVQYFHIFCVPNVLIEKQSHTDPLLT